MKKIAPVLTTFSSWVRISVALHAAYRTLGVQQQASGQSPRADLITKSNVCSLHLNLNPSWRQCFGWAESMQRSSDPVFHYFNDVRHYTVLMSMLPEFRCCFGTAGPCEIISQFLCHFYPFSTQACVFKSELFTQVLRIKGMQPRLLLQQKISHHPTHPSLPQFVLCAKNSATHSTLYTLAAKIFVRTVNGPI